MEINKTERGFAIGKFTDRYGSECRIQKSSLATEDCIWLGLCDLNPQIMASHAKQFGIETNEICGWVPYPIPKEVLIKTEMHLTKDMVKELLPLLKKFAKTGEI